LQKYPASNLLEKGEPKSWKCKTPGESSAVIVLEFDGPTTIAGIDFGNEGSAFVQVDVGKKKGETAPKDDEYKVKRVYNNLFQTNSTQLSSK
jgi:XRCC1 N terminal domain